MKEKEVIGLENIFGPYYLSRNVSTMQKTCLIKISYGLVHFETQNPVYDFKTQNKLFLKTILQ